MPDSVTSPAAGSVTHLIQVRYDPSALTLTVLRPQVFLNPGDTVVWSFFGIPEGWTPWVEFRRAGNNSFVGPLEGLTQSAGEIWGVCRTSGWTGTASVPFEYRAMIQRGFAAGWDTEGSLVWSAPASLNVLPVTIGTERIFQVTGAGSPKAVRTGSALDIEPPGQPLDAGDVIVWRFPSELPDGTNVNDWRPRIKFYRYEGTGTVPNQQLGPFSALTVLPGEIRGTGNNGVSGVYFFEVALVSVSTGEIGWLSSGDPVVDNRGGVIVPDGGPPP
jgi:hypothetical protein